MRIAVASGKGGTGKTTVAVSLALSLLTDAAWKRDQRHPPLLLDCDVEAPDAHLFLHPTIERREQASILVPRVDEGRCTGCGECAEVCMFNALAVLGERVLLFPELCHGCGSCSLICSEDAISEVPRVMGLLEAGPADGLHFAHGVLNVSEPMPVPVIRQLKAWARPQPDQLTIVDAAPGTSCPMVETVRDADFVLLVTEPTPFGLHDLKLALEVVRDLGLAAGVVINRDGIGDRGVEAFCASENLPILLRIPFDRAIAEGLAQGRTLLEVRPEYCSLLAQMARRINDAVLAVRSVEA
ncbi:MAG: (4Fe-4S)-binding protein [Gemmatimonas sp. SM23_52]|nr:MAG: (4Fe-4S)-binding protein [Gemmatimonas sp. SM23_52]